MTSANLQPANPATALFSILRQVYVDNPQQSIGEGLARSFAADNFGSDQFWKIHRQYLKLADHVEILVSADESLSRQYARYVSAWRRGLLTNINWDQPASQNVNSTDIQTLEFLGGTLDVMKLGGGFWDDETLAQVQSVQNMWNNLVGDLNLPPHVAYELQVRINDLSWLINNVQMFGTAPVAEAAEDLTSRAMREVIRPETSTTARQRLGNAIATTMLFLNLANTATHDVAGVLEGVNSIATEVRELENNVPSILDTPDGPAQPDHVIDAEVVNPADPASN